MVFVGCAALAFLLTGYRILAGVWGTPPAWRWALASVMFLLVAGWRSRRAFRARPAHPDRSGLRSVGVATCITLFRGLLVCGLGGFMFSPEPPGLLAWAPATIYAGAVCGDGLDGIVARLRNETSAMGEVLDSEFDALGTLAATLVGCQYGRLPLYYVLVGGAYYIFWLAIWLRTRLGKTSHPLPRRAGRRAVGALQMLFLILVLVPVSGGYGRSAVAAVLAALILGSFFRDWLTATGRQGRAA